MRVRNVVRAWQPSPKDLGGWVLRGGVMLFFILMGLEKFRSGPGAPWPPMFAQIGFGQWFRYFTGVVEIGGGLLFFVPWTSVVGVFLLSCTMVGAMVVHIVVRHSIGSSVFPFVILIAIVLITLREPSESGNASVR